MPKTKTTLAKEFPEIANQWDSEKNDTLTPEDISPGSHKKVWWVCSKSHSWEASIKNRTRRNSGCPYCSGRKATKESSIVSTFPEFAQAMDRYGGQDVSPYSLKPASRKNVYLKCEKGHTWQAKPIEYKNVLGDLCPYCSNRKALPGFNDLATLYPDVACLWDNDLNDVSVHEVPFRKNHNGNVYHWKCDKGHRWERSIYSAVNHPGCPVCKGQEILIGFNDISVFAPQLYKELDSKHKNPEELKKIFPFSNLYLTWVCPQGHGTYQSTMSKRSAGRGCPVCAGVKTLAGVNDIETLHPKLAQQWDENENENITPRDVSSGSRKKVWWKCDRGHSYQAVVNKRTSGTGCPYCANKKVLVGFNDLATIRPDVAQRWHPYKNEGNTPEMFTFRSGHVAWWRCDKGHEWVSDIDHQSGGNSCPKCSHNVSQAESDIADYVKSIIGEDKVITSDRKIISPQELDIYIPSKNIAIEYNGLYWHTESQGKDRYYHFNKWEKCKDKGIQLITIWEDEWRDKPDIVKSMIAHKLGASQDRRVYARKTTSFILGDKSYARKFFDDNHIQGSAPATSYVALSYKGDIVAVSAWKKTGDILYLDRYATSCVVVGGMGKVLSMGKDIAKNLHCTKIITFSDHQVSDGGLYDTLGFYCDKELKPDYRYLVEDKRIHKFNYRLKRFRNDPDLEYKEGLTEKELAQLNGLERIWDCGKTRWVMDIDS